MVGRAAVRSPWIFDQAAARLAPGSQIDLEETVCLFIALLARYQPVEFHPTRLKRFLFYFLDNLCWAHHLKTLANRALFATDSCLSAVERVLRAHFHENPEERLFSIDP